MYKNTDAKKLLFSNLFLKQPLCLHSVFIITWTVHFILEFSDLSHLLQSNISTFKRLISWIMFAPSLNILHAVQCCFVNVSLNFITSMIQRSPGLRPGRRCNLDVLFLTYRIFCSLHHDQYDIILLMMFEKAFHLICTIKCNVFSNLGNILVITISKK